MNPSFLLQVVAVVGLMSLVTTASVGAQQERLSIDKPDWNEQAQAFQLNFSATARLARRAETEGYVLRTTLTIFDKTGKQLALLEPLLHPMRQVDRTSQQSQGMVSLEPQYVDWEGGESVRGPIRLNIMVEVQSSSGEVQLQAVDDWWEDYPIFEADGT